MEARVLYGKGVDSECEGVRGGTGCARWSCLARLGPRAAPAVPCRAVRWAGGQVGRWGGAESRRHNNVV